MILCCSKRIRVFFEQMIMFEVVYFIPDLANPSNNEFQSFCFFN